MDQGITTAIAAVPADNWVARFDTGDELRLLAWAITAKGEAYGVVGTEDGGIPAFELESFIGYQHKPLTRIYESG